MSIINNTCATSLSRLFSKKEIEKDNKYLGNNWILLGKWKYKVCWLYLFLFKMATITKRTNQKCTWGCEGEPLFTAGVNVASALVQPLWKPEGRVSSKNWRYRSATLLLQTQKDEPVQHRDSCTSISILYYLQRGKYGTNLYVNQKTNQWKDP